MLLFMRKRLIHQTLVLWCALVAPSLQGSAQDQPNSEVGAAAAELLRELLPEELVPLLLADPSDEWEKHCAG